MRSITEICQEINTDFPDYGWLVRSVPTCRGGGYFANITSPDFQQVGVGEYEGEIHTARESSPELALEASLLRLREGRPDPKEEVK